MFPCNYGRRSIIFGAYQLCPEATKQYSRAINHRGKKGVCQPPEINRTVRKTRVLLGGRKEYNYYKKKKTDWPAEVSPALISILQQCYYVRILQSRPRVTLIFLFRLSSRIHDNNIVLNIIIIIHGR